MTICKAYFSATICALSCLAPVAWAQLPGASAYDDGVNAFFAGRSGQAEMFLSHAIEFDSQDPRAYYFRALSLLRQGRCDEARGDMMTGAMLEAQQPHRFAIGSVLERVQGPARLILEDYRRNARRDLAVSNGSASSAPRANAVLPNQTYRQGEAEVLREKNVVPLEELLRPGGPHTIPDEPAAQSMPLPPQGKAPAAQPMEQPAAPPAAQPAAKPAANEPNPFGDDSEQPAAKPAPKAAPAPAPAPKLPPQEAPKPTPPANPPADADQNPFG